MDYAAYTESVIAAIGDGASPRVKAAFPVLIRHLHQAVVETGLTTEEWLAACSLLIEAGQVSTSARNEMVLLSDVLGVESLVDMMEHARSSPSSNVPTESAILGPFYKTGVEVQAFGTSVVRKEEAGAAFTHLFGTVRGSDGKPLKGAMVDVWHDAPDGLYDAQSPDKPENHCRGRFETDSEGRYSAVVLKPTPYPIPFDFSAGKLLKMMDRHPMRPAHIHFHVSSPHHKTLVTQVFDRESKYLADDSVFAVKENLIVDFVPVSHPLPVGGQFDDTILWELKYDILLAGDGLPVEPTWTENKWRAAMGLR